MMDSWLTCANAKEKGKGMNVAHISCMGQIAFIVKLGYVLMM